MAVSVLSGSNVRLSIRVRGRASERAHDLPDGKGDRSFDRVHNSRVGAGAAFVQRIRPQESRLLLRLCCGRLDSALVAAAENRRQRVVQAEETRGGRTGESARVRAHVFGVEDLIRIGTEGEGVGAKHRGQRQQAKNTRERSWQLWLF